MVVQNKSKDVFSLINLFEGGIRYLFRTHDSSSVVKYWGYSPKQSIRDKEIFSLKLKEGVSRVSGKEYTVDDFDINLDPSNSSEMDRIFGLSSGHALFGLKSYTVDGKSFIGFGGVLTHSKEIFDEHNNLLKCIPLGGFLSPSPDYVKEDSLGSVNDVQVDIVEPIVKPQYVHGFGESILLISVKTFFISYRIDIFRPGFRSDHFFNSAVDVNTPVFSDKDGCYIGDLGEHVLKSSLNQNKRSYLIEKPNIENIALEPKSQKIPSSNFNNIDVD